MNKVWQDWLTAHGAVWDKQSPPSQSLRNFGNRHAEYAWAKTECACFDLSRAREIIRISGADRQKFFHNFCTQEIRNLQPGQIAEAFVTSIQGKVLGHVWAFVGAESLVLDTVAGSADNLIRHLDRYLITEDVKFSRAEELCDLYLAGPDADDRLQKLGWLSSPLEPQRWISIAHIEIARVEWFGEPGYLLRVPQVDLIEVANKLLSVGVRMAGDDVFSALRLESGWPVYGIDFCEDNLAQEVARTNQAICFGKGCYLGQEPIARIDALGHVNQELRCLRFRTVPAPAPGSMLFLPGEVREGGTITSSILSPATDTPVAMGMLKRNYCLPGTILEFELEDGTRIAGEVLGI